MSRDERRHDRLPFKGKIRLNWQEEGIRRTVIAVCEDASRSGMKIASPTRIELRSFVQLEGMDFKLFGPACVRHCDRQGIGYKLGLEFAGGVKMVVDGEEQKIYAA